MGANANGKINDIKAAQRWRWFEDALEADAWEAFVRSAQMLKVIGLKNFFATTRPNGEPNPLI